MKMSIAMHQGLTIYYDDYDNMWTTESTEDMPPNNGFKSMREAKEWIDETKKRMQKREFKRIRVLHNNHWQGPRFGEVTSVEPNHHVCRFSPDSKKESGYGSGVTKEKTTEVYPVDHEANREPIARIVAMLEEQKALSLQVSTIEKNVKKAFASLKSLADIMEGGNPK